MNRHLAQLNIGRLAKPLDDPAMAEFVAALGPINEIAEATPGFVWRLTDDEGQSSSYVPIPGVDDPLIAVNFSVWEGLESIEHFMYKSGHAAYLRRRREWFQPISEAFTVCWWIESGTVPDLGDGYQRLLHLREHGPTERGWPLNTPVD